MDFIGAKFAKDGGALGGNRQKKCWPRFAAFGQVLHPVLLLLNLLVSAGRKSTA
jgi:hypothetical protein